MSTRKESTCSRACAESRMHHQFKRLQRIIYRAVGHLRRDPTHRYLVTLAGEGEEVYRLVEATNPVRAMASTIVEEEDAPIVRSVGNKRISGSYDQLQVQTRRLTYTLTPTMEPAAQRIACRLSTQTVILPWEED